MTGEKLPQLNTLKNKLIAWLAESGVALLVAVLIIAFGVRLAESLAKRILKLCDQRGIDYRAEQKIVSGNSAQYTAFSAS